MKFAFEMVDKLSGPSSKMADSLAAVEAKLKAVDRAAKLDQIVKATGVEQKRLVMELKRSDLIDKMSAAEKKKTAIEKQQAAAQVASDKRRQVSLDRTTFAFRAAFGDGATDMLQRFVKGTATVSDKAAVARGGLGLMGQGIGLVAGAAVAATAALLTAGAAAGGLAIAGGKMLLDAQRYRDTTQAALTFQLGSAEAAQKTMGFLAGISRATGQDRRTVTEQFSKLVGSGLTTGESQQLVQLAASLKVASGGQDIGVEKLGDALLSLKRNEALSVEKSFAGLLAAGGQNRVYEALAKQLNIKSAGLDPVAVKRLVDQRLAGADGGMGLRGQKAVDVFAKVNLEVAGEKAFGGLQQAFQAKTVTGAIDLIQQRIRGLFDDANASPLATRLLGILNRVATALDPASDSGKQLMATLDGLIAGAADLWDVASPLVEALGQGFGTGFSEALAIVQKLTASMGGGKSSVDGFAEALRTIGTVLGYVVVGVGSALAVLGYLEAKVAGLGAAILGAAGSIGVALVDGIANGVDSAKAKLVARLESLAQLLPDSVRKLLQIKSPSRVMMKLGAYSAEGFAQGVERGGPSVERAADAGLAQPAMQANVRAGGGRGGSVTVAPGAVQITVPAGSNVDTEALARMVDERLRALFAEMGLELGAVT